MAQKSNPISLRLNKTNKNWDSCWYGDYFYTKQLLQDLKCKTYIKTVCKQAKMHSPFILLNAGHQQIRMALFFPRTTTPRARSSLEKKGFSEKTGVKPLQRYDISPVTGGKVSGKLLIRPLGGGATRHVSSQETRDQIVQEKRGLIRYFLLGLFAAQSKRRAGKNPLLFLERGGVLAAMEEQEQKKSKSLNSFSSKFLLPPEVTRRGLWDTLSNVILGRPTFVGTAMERNLHPSAVRPFPAQIAGTTFSLLATPVKGEGPTTPTPFRDHLEWVINCALNSRCKIYPLLCHSTNQNPHFLAGQIVSSLQEKVPFRRLKHQIIRDIKKSNSIKGVRISCSGRVAARSKKAQKAKTESIQWGQTSLHVFSESLSFASESAYTPFGKIGVKVWICYR